VVQPSALHAWALLHLQSWNLPSTLPLSVLQPADHHMMQPQSENLPPHEVRRQEKQPMMWRSSRVQHAEALLIFRSVHPKCSPYHAGHLHIPLLPLVPVQLAASANTSNSSQDAAAADDVIPDPVLAFVTQTRLPAGIAERRLLTTGSYGYGSTGSYGYGSPSPSPSPSPVPQFNDSDPCSPCQACIVNLQVGRVLLLSMTFEQLRALLDTPWLTFPTDQTCTPPGQLFPLSSDSLTITSSLQSSRDLRAI
jgi:hypothetical protein